MSLPPLPDIFGNYVLGDFNEVVSPPAIDWLPQTPGWYAIAALLALLLLRRLWRWLLYWQRNRYRGEARRRLQALGAGPGLPAQVNEILKLSAIAAVSREQVASLSGAEWPGFLNALCDTPPFAARDCDMLAVGVYRQDTIEDQDAQRLIDAAERWVSTHRNRFDA
jgi:hypothetical protein